MTTQVFKTPLFIFSLIILILNDVFLKYYFPNFLTGKLSDLAGLLVFSLFFRAFFSKFRTFIFVATCLLFIYWKLPLSQPLIDFLNYCFLPIDRVVDYSDLGVLPIVGFLYYTNFTQYYFPMGNIAKGFVVLVSIMAMCATSVRFNQLKPLPFCDYSLNNYVYEIKSTRASILLTLQNQGYIIENDTLRGLQRNRGSLHSQVEGHWQTPYLIIRNIAIPNGDTIKQVNFQISDLNDVKEIKSQVQLMGICLNKPLTFGNLKELEKKLKLIKKHIETNIIKKNGQN